MCNKEIEDLKTKIETMEELGTFGVASIEEDIRNIKADLYDLTAAIVRIEKILESNNIK